MQTCISTAVFPQRRVLGSSHTFVILPHHHDSQTPLTTYNPVAPKSGKFLPPGILPAIPYGSTIPGQGQHRAVVSPTEMVIFVSGFSLR